MRYRQSAHSGPPLRDPPPRHPSHRHARLTPDTFTPAPGPGPAADDPGQRRHHRYDAWNRLVAVHEDNGQGQAGDLLVTYRYNGLNHRITKLLGSDDQNPDERVDYYYNASWQVVEEHVDGAVHAQYIWCLRYIDSPILRDRDTPESGSAALDERLYYTTDANMNVTALVAPGSGAVVERYVYDPYGRVVFLKADWSLQQLDGHEDGTASAVANEILFAGYRFNPETGQYHVRHREYHPTLGRWMQRDPLGYVDGMSLYDYARSMPTAFIDPEGTHVLAAPALLKIGKLAKELYAGATALHGILNLFRGPSITTYWQHDRWGAWRSWGKEFVDVLPQTRVNRRRLSKWWRAGEPRNILHQKRPRGRWAYLEWAPARPWGAHIFSMNIQFRANGEEADRAVTIAKLVGIDTLEDIADKHPQGRVPLAFGERIAMRCRCDRETWFRGFYTIEIMKEDKPDDIITINTENWITTADFIRIEARVTYSVSGHRDIIGEFRPDVPVGGRPQLRRLTTVQDEARQRNEDARAYSLGRFEDWYTVKKIRCRLHLPAR